MEHLYRIADKIIGIRSLYPLIHEQCREYLSEGEPDFWAVISPRDIAFEREKSAKTDDAYGLSVRHCPDDYLETLAVHRKIAERMPDYDTVLFHGSAIAVDGQAYLFAAASGTGKSTHTRLWRELLGERAVMVNDDKPLIRMTENGAIIYGTPWNGKHRLSSNISVPLKAVCILERAEENTIRPVTGEEALPALIRQTYRPAGPAAMAKTLSLTGRLSRSVRLYRLGCRIDIRAAELSCRTIKDG